jgi:hypothetical protein
MLFSFDFWSAWSSKAINGVGQIANTARAGIGRAALCGPICTRTILALTRANHNASSICRPVHR